MPNTTEAPPEPETTTPAATGETSTEAPAKHEHDYKLIVNKNGRPTPSTNPPGNVRCNCGAIKYAANPG